MIILADDATRENEGDLVFAAEKSTAELVNMMSSDGRGLICMPMTRAWTQRLKLPQQVFNNEAHLKTAFTVSIDAARGITTGISASDRCQTILAACHEKAQPQDLVRPGHIFPLEARDGGCLVRPGHTEAAVDLARLAGLKPCAVICEILDKKGEPERLPGLLRLGRKLGIGVYTIRDLVEVQLRREPLVQRVSSVSLPTLYGHFHLHVYQSLLPRPEDQTDHDIHLALTHGKKRFNAKDEPLVRVHAEWSIDGILRRLSRPEGSRLNQAMRLISEQGNGAIVLLRQTPPLSSASLLKPPARPADIWTEKGRLKSWGMTDPNMSIGLGAQILRDLGIRRMRLLSNSNSNFNGIGQFDLHIVSRQPI